MKCADCKFWVERTGGSFDNGVGECRRYAARPLIIADHAESEPKSPFVAWPLTLNTLFCGDFASRADRQSFV